MVSRFIVLLLVFVCSSCVDSDKARTETVEACFGIDIPECATLTRNDIKSVEADYEFWLEFKLSQDCLEEFQKELPKAQKYLVDQRINYEKYEWIKGEYEEKAVMEIYEKSGILKFNFIHF